MENSAQDTLWVESFDGERGGPVREPSHSPRSILGAWELTGRTHPTSLSDLRAMSEPARYWLSGYLAGNEPEISDVFPDLEGEPAIEEQVSHGGSCVASSERPVVNGDPRITVRRLRSQPPLKKPL